MIFACYVLKLYNYCDPKSFAKARDSRGCQFITKRIFSPNPKIFFQAITAK